MFIYIYHGPGGTNNKGVCNECNETSEMIGILIRIIIFEFLFKWLGICYTRWIIQNHIISNLNSTMTVRCNTLVFLYHMAIQHYQLPTTHDNNSFIRSPRNDKLPHGYIHVWAVTTDCGPDQQATRKSLRTIFASGSKLYERQLLFELPCLKHQFHLICADALRLTDRMLKKFDTNTKKYFAGLAQIVHCWRAHAKKVSHAWSLLFPDNVSSDKASRTLPPVAISGRWGSITCI